jgi:hypothetical protein
MQSTTWNEPKNIDFDFLNVTGQATGRTARFRAVTAKGQNQERWRNLHQNMFLKPHLGLSFFLLQCWC